MRSLKEIKKKAAKVAAAAFVILGAVGDRKWRFWKTNGRP